MYAFFIFVFHFWNQWLWACRRKGWCPFVCSHITIWMAHMWMRSSFSLSSICMSHVTYEPVMSRVNESCHTWMYHGTCECVATCRSLLNEWVTSRINELCHVWTSHVTCECVMVHVKAQLLVILFGMNESCHVRTSRATLWVCHGTCERRTNLCMNEFSCAWMSSLVHECILCSVCSGVLQCVIACCSVIQ